MLNFLSGENFLIAAQRRRFRFALAALSLAVRCLCGGETLAAQSLDSLVAEALRNNPQNRMFRAAVKAADARIEGAGAMPAPTLGVEFQQIEWGKFNVLNGAISNNLSVSQMFPLGGKLEAMRNAERERAETVHHQWTLFTDKLRADITSAYAMLWRVDRQRDLAAFNRKLIERSIEAALTQYRADKVSYADVMKLEAEKALAALKQTTIETERNASFAMISALVGRDKTASSPLPDITPRIDTALAKLDETPTPERLRDRLAGLSEVNHALQTVGAMIEMTKAELIANDKERIPDLMGQAMIMRMPQGMTLAAASESFLSALESPFERVAQGTNVKAEWMYSLMASVTLPFAPWSVGKYDAKEQELKATMESQTHEREAMRQMLAAQCEEAAQTALAAAATIRALQGSVVPLYEKALEAQLADLGTGRTTILAILDTERMLVMKRDELLMAWERYFLALARIEAILAEPLR